MDDDQIEALQKKAREILEKRNFERFRAKLQVRYRPISGSELAALERESHFSATTSEKGRTRETKELFKVFSEDVSEGGMRINTDIQLDTASRVLVELHLPDLPLPVSAIAEVMWSRPVEGGGFACGLKFDQINKSELSKLERYLLLQRKSAP